MPPPIRKLVSDVYVGIDPGKGGGIASLYGSCGVDTLEVMPCTELGIWEVFKGLEPAEGAQVKACIEWIHPAIQGVGKSSMSKLYGTYMQLRGFLIASGIPFEDEKTAAWVRALGIPAKKKNEQRTPWKNRLKGEAQQRFPNIAPQITLLTADALLIAEHCRRKHKER